MKYSSNFENNDNVFNIDWQEVINQMNRYSLKEKSKKSKDVKKHKCGQKPKSKCSQKSIKQNRSAER